MKFDIRERKSIVIIVLDGEMVGGPDATVLIEKLHDLIDSGKNRIVVDLAKVDWMNSSGLGILIGGLTTMRNNGGDLKLASITERIQSLLMITKLLTVFESYDTIEKAIESFN